MARQQPPRRMGPCVRRDDGVDAVAIQGMTSRSRGALRPRFASSFALLETEGAGETGCLLHPRSRVRFAQTKMHTSIQGSGNTPAPSLRNGFTAYFVLFPENGFLASVVAQIVSRNLAPSTAAPEPHDFAVRVRRVRLSRPQRPSHLTARS